jgi:hypothetical protein
VVCNILISVTSALLAVNVDRVLVDIASSLHGSEVVIDV